MSDSAALLVDEVLPPVPIRQWVLRVPFALRYLFARDPKAMSAALLIVYSTIAGFQIRNAGLRRRQGECGAVTLIQALWQRAELEQLHTAGSDSTPRALRIKAVYPSYTPFLLCM
jgi:hypothetical protein